jgi:hypothetical protein
MKAASIFVFVFLLSVALVGIVWVTTRRLTPEKHQSQIVRWLLSWSIKGLALPLALWTIMNIGISWNLQPFMPQIQFAKNNGLPWAPPFLSVMAAGLFILTSYWTALTLGWVLTQKSIGLAGEARADFKGLCLTSLLALSLPAAGIVWLGGWPWVGLAASLILAPIAGYAPANIGMRSMPPMYSRAIARIKFGKYAEAEWEIIRQLEKCEDDFQGWMMMAELYANHFRDLNEAEQTILEICDQPKVSPSQLSIALHKLADWQLGLGGDPDAARRSLQVICDRLKGTHLARMAQIRMNQLPLTAGELKEQHSSAPIPLPALGDNLDEESAGPESTLAQSKAVELAKACVERLNQDPDNVPAREKLARLLADHMNQPEQALEQIVLLLNIPDQPDSKRAEWLGLTAAWHMRHRQDFESAQKVLERLVREFPQTPQALAARRRLRNMGVEYRG